MHGSGTIDDRVATKNGANALGPAEIFELPRHLGGGRIKHIEGHAAGLAQLFRRLFEITVRFVAETAALRIDLDATLHDHRPIDQDGTERRHRAVTPIGAEMRKFGAELFAPRYRIAAIARMAEIEGIGHLRNEAAHKFRITAIAVASQPPSPRRTGNVGLCRAGERGMI